MAALEPKRVLPLRITQALLSATGVLEILLAKTGTSPRPASIAISSHKLLSTGSPKPPMPSPEHSTSSPNPPGSSPLALTPPPSSQITSTKPSNSSPQLTTKSSTPDPFLAAAARAPSAHTAATFLSSHPALKSNIPDPSTTTSHISPPFISKKIHVITPTRHTRSALCAFWLESRRMLPPSPVGQFDRISHRFARREPARAPQRRVRRRASAPAPRPKSRRSPAPGSGTTPAAMAVLGSVS